jgi:hypothetical protein
VALRTSPPPSLAEGELLFDLQMDRAGDRYLSSRRERQPLHSVLPYADTVGALLSSDDYGSSVERTATLHPLWQARVRWYADADSHEGVRAQSKSGACLAENAIRTSLTAEGWAGATHMSTVRTGE